uniref:ShKT domain-containing protein n=1 Tax=Caenorhabditis tropicalis TaxID=1561998 RepID=A0A1I7UUI9_9PELO
MKFLILLLLVAVATITAKPQHPFAQMFRKGNQLADDCKDIGTNCQNWARNGFCTNCNWTCAQRRHYCDRTCGFCHPDYVCNETCPTFVPRKSEFLTKEEIKQLDQ